MLLERNAALTTQPDAIPKLLESLQSKEIHAVPRMHYLILLLAEVSDLAREAGAKLEGLTGRLADVDLPEIVGYYWCA